MKTLKILLLLTFTFVSTHVFSSRMSNMGYMVQYLSTAIITDTIVEIEECAHLYKDKEYSKFNDKMRIIKTYLDPEELKNFEDYLASRYWLTIEKRSEYETLEEYKKLQENHDSKTSCNLLHGKFTDTINNANKAWKRLSKEINDKFPKDKKREKTVDLEF